MSNYGFPQAKTIDLIRTVEKYPQLYNLQLGRQRWERQKIWDEITRRCGYSKTEETKNKWRALVSHLRQHLENVEKKTLRRYIPKTDNPDDQYVHLNDWHYYKYIKFMTPYIRPRRPRPNRYVKTRGLDPEPQRAPTVSQTKITPTSAVTVGSDTLSTNPNINRPFPTTTATTTNITTVATASSSSKTPIQLQIGDVILEIKVDKPQAAQKLSSPAANSRQLPVRSTTPATATLTAAENTQPVKSATTFEQLSVNDQNLKAFFDAMLRSTQRLPKFHQERIKCKLMTAIGAQK